jgi:membrane protein YdbS with pleckstrin-like domain
LLLLGGWIVVSALLTGAIVAWPPVRYRHTAYEVSAQGIRIRRGVFWRSVATVPRSRVQHTDVSQGPIERAYELATLVMYTAGTQHSSVLLPGLAHETALAIRDHLIAGGEDDAV